MNCDSVVPGQTRSYNKCHICNFLKCGLLMSKQLLWGSKTFVLQPELLLWLLFDQQILKPVVQQTFFTKIFLDLTFVKDLCISCYLRNFQDDRNCKSSSVTKCLQFIQFLTKSNELLSNEPNKSIIVLIYHSQLDYFST